MLSRSLVLLVIAAPLLLAACDNSPSPLMLQAPRAGADKAAPLVRSLPSAPPRQYEPGIAPEDDERGAKVGQAVRGSGGQLAQKEKEARAQAAVEADLARQRDELARQQNPDTRVSTQ